MLFALLGFAVPVTVVVPSAALAQAANGVLAGTVRGQGSPLAGATVTVTGPVTRATTTGPDGAFQFGDLPAGTYDVTVTQPGFRRAETVVTFTANGTQSLPLAFTLETATLTTIGGVSTQSRATAINTSPAALTVVNAQTFVDRGNFQLPNILEELPGVELERFDSSAPGSNVTISIRGADSYETQTLIDGHPVSGGYYGDYLIQFLNPLMLSNIEIAKGPGALSDTIENAIGGSVNFRTPSITSRPTGQFSLGYDSFNGSTYSGLFSDTIGKVGFLVGYARFGTPGYYYGSILSVAPDGPTGPGLVPNATVNMAIPATQSFDNRSELVKLGYNFSPSTTLTLGYFGSQTYVDYTGNLTTVEPVHIVSSCASCALYNSTASFGSGTTPTYNNPAYANLVGHTILAATTEDNLYLGNYENETEPIFTADLRSTIGRGTFLARYYATAINREIPDPAEANQIIQCDDPACSLAAAASNFDLSGAYYEKELDTLRGGDLEYDFPLGASTVTASYDTHNDQTTYCSGTNPVLPPKNCSLNNYVENSRTISLRANVPLSARLQMYVGNYFSSTTGVGGRYDPRLAFLYRAAPNVIVRASAGTSFVAPYASLQTHLSGRTLVQDFGTLAPESSFGYDLGTDIATGRDSKITFDAYNTIIHNRFETEGGIPTTGTFDGVHYSSVSGIFNVGDTEMRGLELSFIKQPRVGLGGYASVDLLRAYPFGSGTVTPPISASGVYTSSAGNYGNEAYGSQVVGFPYNKDRAELNYTFRSGARVAFGMTAFGQNNTYYEPGFSVFDLGGTAPLAQGFRLVFSVQNLFDHDDGRVLSEYAFGTAPTAAPGVTFPLNFVTPRTVTLQLMHSLGPAH